MYSRFKMNEIQNLKAQGYSMRDIIRYYDERGGKVPSLPTLRKYYKMSSVPENPGQAYEKKKAFDVEPFRSCVIEIMTRNAGRKVYVSSVYELLTEKFVDSGEYESLPGNEQTLRNYVSYLEASEQIPKRSASGGRVYHFVEDCAPGQMLVDFGQYDTGHGLTVHFMCHAMRRSRMLYVYAQDHRFNSREACEALYKTFVRMGGIPREIVIDQDAVFVADETAGEVKFTETFGDFVREQGFEVWTCNKRDPESKGVIEKCVATVKSAYLSARDIRCMDDVWNTLPAWLDRVNARINKATYCVPADVFESDERGALQPIRPSVYDSSPVGLTERKIESTPYILYRSNRYKLPNEYAFKKVRFKVVCGKMFAYDEENRPICDFLVSEENGKIVHPTECGDVKKDEETREKWVDIRERIRRKWNCGFFNAFMDELHRTHTRNTSKQLRAIEGYLNSQKPDGVIVDLAMQECCGEGTVSFAALRARCDLYAARESAGVAPGSANGVDMEFYEKAARARTAGSGDES